MSPGVHYPSVGLDATWPAWSRMCAQLTGLIVLSRILPVRTNGTSILMGDGEMPALLLLANCRIHTFLGLLCLHVKIG